MNVKSPLLSVVLALTLAGTLQAQPFRDFADLFGLQQPRQQEKPITVDYNIDFHYFLDLRSFGVSDDIFMESANFNVARFSPSAVLRFNQGREASHKLTLGVDLTKDLGATQTVAEEYSEEEHQSSIRNTALIKDIFFYYNYTRHTSRGHLGFTAGIFPRTVLGGDYTRAIFADDIIYYDPNIEGLTIQYRAPRFRAELTGDMVGKKGIDRIGAQMAFTSGEYRPFKWAAVGWSGAFTHVDGKYLGGCNVDFALANPYVKFDFAPLLHLQEFYLKAGGIGSYHLDHQMVTIDMESGETVAEKPHFPYGGEAVLGVRHWGLGIEDTFYYGYNQMEYFGSKYAETKALIYAETLYQGEEFYFTRRSVPVWYNRAEAYWQPLGTDFIKARVSAVAHFITPALTDDGKVGPYIGLQAKASMIFNLDAFRHPEDLSLPSRPARVRHSQPSVNDRQRLDKGRSADRERKSLLDRLHLRKGDGTGKKDKGRKKGKSERTSGGGPLFTL